jgi:hypothetical protein
MRARLSWRRARGRRYDEPMRRAALIAFALTLGACARSHAPVYSLGPYARADAELFAALEGAIQRVGYTIAQREPERGILRVTARTAPATLRIQATRGGWVVVLVEGSTVRYSGDEQVMHSALRGEYDRFTIALRHQLESEAAR